jgi:uncharacterized YigZ family protein
MSSYRIPAAEARVEIRVVNSRFVASAAPAPSVDAAKAFIERVRAEMPDASHHVYAFLVGHGASVTAGMSDAGEPSGTAGRPALAVLRGSDLGDAAVVVTRYFGGTLLGTGGLVRAYGDAVKAVLAELPTAEKVELATLLVALPYPSYGLCKQLLTRFSAAITSEEFATDVTLTLTLPVEQAEALAEALAEATAGAAMVVEA